MISRCEKLGFERVKLGWMQLSADFPLAIDYAICVN